MTAAQSVRRNPFPGLRPFEANEEYLFFGREAQIDDLLGRLRRQRFITVTGTSGSGKSSLVRAGMLPALYGGFMAGVGTHWRVAVMRPGGEPVPNLARALAGCGVPNPRTGSAELREGLNQAVLERGALGLVELVQQAHLDPDENVLILVDQFEELFRFRPGSATNDVDDEAAAFVKLLLAAVSCKELPVYVVLTMRSDFLGDCARFRELPQGINDGLFLVPRMSREQLRQAIEGPVGVAGGRIAPRLVNRLLNDLGDNPDQLPVLQHALMRTWDIWEADHATDEPIDVRHYEATGGLREALSRHGDEIYNALPSDRSREVTEKLFKCLTDRGSDNRGLRRPTRFADACAIVGASPDEVQEVLEAFRAPGCSFLMPPAGSPIDDSTVLDISHESLMRIWTRLQQWIDEEAQSAQVYRRLAEAAFLYARHRTALWRDPDVSIAREWRNATQPNQSWAERYAPGFANAMQFLNASLRRRQWLRACVAGLISVALLGSLAAVANVLQENRAITAALNSLVAPPPKYGISPKISLIDIRDWTLGDRSDNRLTIAHFLDRLVASNQHPTAVLLDVFFAPCQSPCRPAMRLATAELERSLRKALSHGIPVFAAIRLQFAPGEEPSGIEPYDADIYASLTGWAHDFFSSITGVSGVTYQRCYPVPYALGSSSPYRAPTVTQIIAYGHFQTAAAIALHALDGSILRDHLALDEFIPNNVAFEVPGGVAIQIKWPNANTAWLEPGSYTFKSVGGGREMIAGGIFSSVWSMAVRVTMTNAYAVTSQCDTRKVAVAYSATAAPLHPITASRPFPANTNLNGQWVIVGSTKFDVVPNSSPSGLELLAWALTHELSDPSIYSP